jgi:hypothetical protein
MTAKRKSRAILRWWLSALVILAGLSATWAWGQVARLAEADPEAAGPQEASLYAIWQTEGSRAPGLYRSADGGQNWELLRLPAAVLPRTTVQPASLSGASQLAVVTDDGVLVSNDAGDTWATTIQGLEVLSLAWAADGSLYLGTDGQGIYRLPAGGAEAVPVSTSAPGPAAAAVTQLAGLQARGASLPATSTACTIPTMEVRPGNARHPSRIGSRPWLPSTLTRSMWVPRRWAFSGAWTPVGAGSLLVRVWAWRQARRSGSRPSAPIRGRRACSMLPSTTCWAGPRCMPALRGCDRWRATELRARYRCGHGGPE